MARARTPQVGGPSKIDGGSIVLLLVGDGGSIALLLVGASASVDGASAAVLAGVTEAGVDMHDDDSASGDGAGAAAAGEPAEQDCCARGDECAGEAWCAIGGDTRSGVVAGSAGEVALDPTREVCLEAGLLSARGGVSEPRGPIPHAAAGRSAAAPPTVDDSRGDDGERVT